MANSRHTQKQRPYDYERVIHIILSLYRFFAYVLAVILIQVVTLDIPGALDAQAWAILSVAGIYTLLKVFSPLRWQEKDRVTYIILGGDIIICILLLLLTGGLGSSYLLYAPISIITAALLFDESIAISAASMISISLIVAHVGLAHWSTRFAWIMEGNYLPLLIVYIIFCFLIVILSYRTNLNIRRRIVTDAILDERRRIRGELHDGVAQALSYLNLKTGLVRDSVRSHEIKQALAGLEEIQNVVKDAYDDVRESIDSLSVGLNVPLIPALAAYIEEFGQRNGINSEFHPPQTLLQLSPIAEIQLLRIAHEALTNVRKHSLATEVRVSLVCTPHEIEMAIKDNGQGLPMLHPEESAGSSHGLKIMKERAESLGGTFHLSSKPGEGTAIRICIPTEKVRI